MTMRTKDRELLSDETGRRLLTLLSRFGQVRETYPWLRPHCSHAELRRIVARLRSGAMPSIDSRIPAHALADLLEGAMEQDLIIRETVAEMHELTELEQRLKRR
jgi:cation diffusion facilitator CzcD-associated flavoprotein CzcO